VFEGLDYPHDLSHDLSERTVYIPSVEMMHNALYDTLCSLLYTVYRRLAY
jgi:hypothetical protein